MAPTVLLIRHGQAAHNATHNAQDFDLPDPGLTPEGEEQCRKLHENLQVRLAGVDPSDVAVVVSPMRRTIQTALIGLDFLRQQGVPFEADADWQETTSKPCDTGTDITVLKAEFPEIDFSTLDPVFPDKTSPAGHPYSWGRTALLARGVRARENLRKRPHKWVIAVSHSGFLRQSVSGWWYFNSDYRIFDFVAPDEETSVDEEEREESGLKLWPETNEGGMGWSWYKRVKLGEGMKADE